MNDENAQKLYVEFMQLQERVQELQSHMESMGEQISNLEKTKDTVQQLQSLSEPTEAWVQLAPGAYTKAMLKPQNTILLHIGSSAAVEKAPEQVLGTLTRHKETLEAMRDEAFKEFSEAINKLDEIRKQVEAAEKA